MKVLVAVSSKHGSTQEIAYAIGQAMIKRGIEADVKNIDDIENATGYQAAVLGSAVYAGNWLKPARQFVERNSSSLCSLPVWLFSSGPIGEPLKPEPNKAVQIDKIVEATKAVEHRIFAGRLDKSRLNFAERAIIGAVGGKDGDFRDWNEIKLWATSIAEDLRTSEKGK